MIPVDLLAGEDEEDARRLNEMVIAARDFITSYPWCPQIRAMHFAGGAGGVIAVFLVEFHGKARGADERLWVVVGDLPSMHMIVRPDDTIKSVLESFCATMEKWLILLEGGEKFDGHAAVEVPEVADYANLLRLKVQFVRSEIIPLACADQVGATMPGSELLS